MRILLALPVLLFRERQNHLCYHFPMVRLSKIQLTEPMAISTKKYSFVLLHLHRTHIENNIQITATFQIQIKMFSLYHNQHHSHLFPERSFHPKRGFSCILSRALENKWLPSTRIFERFRLDNFSYFGVGANRD